MHPRRAAPWEQKPVEVQKTLPHALSRAAASGAVEVGPGRLANVLKTYAVTQDKVGTARTRMDEEIRYAVVSLGSFLAGERAEIRERTFLAPDFVRPVVG